MKAITKALTVLACGFAMAAQARAGDIATFQPIGFSKDGGIFAFEQYGVQDGSGFAYSDVFVIDTVNDRFLPGTPIRVRMDDESAPMSAAREQSLAKASPFIAEHRLADHPGRLVAFNPVSEQGIDPHRVSYLPYPTEPAFGAPYALQIEEYAVDPPERCKVLEEEIRAFRLTLTERDGAPADETIHEDGGIPASRSCPTGYRLGGIMTYLEGEEPIHIALVLVLSYGFEGRDGRWIAVPFRP